jgi:hypothetical protein
VTVDAMNSVRIFIHFQPSKGSSKASSRNDEDDEELELRKDHKVKTVEICIFNLLGYLITLIDVSCSTVKDYQQVITLRADCYNPQMQISSTSLVFVGNAMWRTRRDVSITKSKTRSTTDEELEDIEIVFQREQRAKQVLIANNFKSHLECIFATFFRDPSAYKHRYSKERFIVFYC